MYHYYIRIRREVEVQERERVVDTPHHPSIVGTRAMYQHTHIIYIYRREREREREGERERERLQRTKSRESLLDGRRAVRAAHLRSESYPSHNRVITESNPSYPGHI
jgi:hypothetical protein